MGDVIRTTSILAGLRRKHAEAEIVWATDVDAQPLLNDLHGVSVCPAQSEEWQKEYDWLINLEDDVHWCQAASRIKSGKLSGGYWDGACKYTDDLAEWFGMGLLAPDREKANELKRINQRTFNQILFDGLALGEPLPPSIVVSEESKERWEGFEGCVGLNTGAGSRWEFKKWGEQQTAELAKRFAHPVLLLGGPAERERNQRIAELCGGRVTVAPNNMSLSDFAALVGKLKLLVSSDSLAMHLAVAQKVPTVAFFGPTSSAEIDLFGCGEKVTTPLLCRTCYLRTCNVRPHCMDAISVDQMWEAISRHL